MRILNSLIFACLFPAATATGQSLFLKEQPVDLDDATPSAWVFPVKEDLDRVLEDARSFMKDRVDVRLKKERGDIMMAEKVSVPELSDKRGDLICYGIQRDTALLASVIFRLGYDISLNSSDYPTQMQQLHTLGREFMSYHYNRYYNDRLDDLQKALNAAEKELNTAQNRIQSLGKDLEGLEKKADKEEDPGKQAELKSQITTVSSDQQLLYDTLPGLRRAVEGIRAEREQVKSRQSGDLELISHL